MARATDGDLRGSAARKDKDFGKRFARLVVGRNDRDLLDPRFAHASLWHAGGMQARELAERMGHSKASMSLDVYTDVIASEEAKIDTVSALIQP